jgi:flavorubredoxin
MPRSVEFRKGVHWVGAVDWNIRDFHGYTTNRGTTYNAYLIVGEEKTALVDAVKAPFAREMLSRIESVLDPSRIDYIVVNHVEMDHSGALPMILERAPGAKLLATENGIKALHRHYRREWLIESVKTGREVDLGGKTLQFLEAYMLHWPDSMFTYLKEDHVLLSNDGFGQHFASCARFDDENPEEAVMEEAAKYYANILMPLGPLLPPLLKKVKKMGIPIDVIAPSHGVIWRANPGKIVQAYLDWSTGVAEDRVLIVYDSMWGSTEAMALAIADGIERGGAECKVLHLRRNHYSDVTREVLAARVLVVGSPTLNEGLFPSVAQFLSYLKGLRPLKKKGLAFGSYGWGGEALPAIVEALKGMGVEVLDPGVGVVYVPGDDDLESCVRLGERLAASMGER